MPRWGVRSDFGHLAEWRSRWRVVVPNESLTPSPPSPDAFRSNSMSNTFWRETFVCSGPQSDRSEWRNGSTTRAERLGRGAHESPRPGTLVESHFGWPPTEAGYSDSRPRTFVTRGCSRDGWRGRLGSRSARSARLSHASAMLSSRVLLSIPAALPAMSRASAANCRYSSCLLMMRLEPHYFRKSHPGA